METLGISLVKAKSLLEKMSACQELLKIERGNKVRFMLYPEDMENAVYPPFNQKEAVLAFAGKRETFTNEEVRILLNATINSVHVLLSTMVKEGRIRRIRRGVYSAIDPT